MHYTDKHTKNGPNCTCGPDWKCGTDPPHAAAESASTLKAERNVATARTEVVVAEYIWCSGLDTHHDIRSKCKTLTVPVGTPIRVEDLPEWNFDGSSTNQATGKDTEILIRPCRVWPHPFLKGTRAVVVLCDCYTPNGEPTEDNTRVVAKAVFEHEKAQGLKPWFGMEQEYVLMRMGRPYNWPETGFPRPQGPYYCSNGASSAFGRHFAMEHLMLCTAMGINISGTNAEVMPAQWEFQIGPCEGLEMGDHMVAARWVYLRVLEASSEAYLDISFDCKPIPGDWNGSGMHTNFSTEAMRNEGGLDLIYAALERLRHSVQHNISFYGRSNNRRMTGKHETSRLDQFTFGVGTRGSSVRIPNQTAKDHKGYFEDRRPASDADPYLVSASLFSSACEIPAEGLVALEPKHRAPWMDQLTPSAPPT